MSFLTWGIADSGSGSVNFPKKEHCSKLTKEIWMTERKYVEDLIEVCRLKQKFEEHHADGYSSRIMFGGHENSVEKIILLHRYAQGKETERDGYRFCTGIKF